MRIPATLLSLTELGIVTDVVRPLMSGKEAEVFLVMSGGEQRVAKVYKEAQNRSFKHRSTYTEGRAVRNSRDQRAMEKRTRHGKAQDEAAWRSTEVDMIYRLRNAGVRVPTPYHFIDGVLIMELVTDAEGLPAPRLGEMSLTREHAIRVFDQLLVEVVRMVCAGVVHGDLSDFNVLMSATGPVVIDFPQAVDASSNQNARTLLLRDVGNLQRFLQRFAPDRPTLQYGQEIWDLYSRNQLTPDTRIGGRFRQNERKADTAEVLSLIGDADRDEQKRREALGIKPIATPFRPRRVEVVMTPPPQASRTRPQGGPPPQGTARGGSPYPVRTGPQGASPQAPPTVDRRDAPPQPLRNVPHARQLMAQQAAANGQPHGRRGPPPQGQRKGPPPQHAPRDGQRPPQAHAPQGRVPVNVQPPRRDAQPQPPRPQPPSNAASTGPVLSNGAGQVGVPQPQGSSRRRRRRSKA